ncbi:hypothetical protein GXW73_08620 [Roseomonas hellenica]|nr:hypothetical protein [Plastoroseomonas hellenica]
MTRLIAALAAMLGICFQAQAQEFPARPISMLVVFAPGGATDVLARLVADHMARTLGQRVLVENVSGAGGTIGGARGAQAAPDGHTLTVGSLGSHSAALSIYRSIQYDPRNLTPIGLSSSAAGCRWSASRISRPWCAPIRGGSPTGMRVSAPPTIWPANCCATSAGCR